MGFIVDARDVSGSELRVTLRGRKSRVAKQFLDRPQIRAFFQHVRAKRVAERVRVDIRRKAACNCYRRYDPSDTARGERPAAKVDQ